MNNTNHRLSIENIEDVIKIINPIFLNSPQFECKSLNETLGLNLIIKNEIENPVKCFKARGSEVFISKAKSGSYIICASAGNFGQAMAYSAKKKDINLTVYASHNANAVKIKKMKSLGANVILYGNDFDEAKVEAKRKAQEIKARFIEDSLDIESLEGAGTIGIELLKYPKKIDTVLVALGNGALLNGIARFLKHYNPEIKIIAVQAKGAPAMVNSWKTNTLIKHEKSETIADGVNVRIPIPQALKDMKGMVDDAILVEDESIIKGMKLLFKHLNLEVEPSAAVGIAAILENKSAFKNQNVATVICGGNITKEQKDKWLK
jgi:threonine dehydratase